MKQPENHFDFILIGGGIMSATLAIFIHELQPDSSIAIFEQLNEMAMESSSAWNNAGTGHSAFCELNYTPEDQFGNIDISKAEKIAQQFEISKQFWAYLIKKNYISSPEEFINSCPHISLVFGEKNISFLKRRFQKLTQSPLFSEMEYSEDFSQLQNWMPLIMENRNSSEKIAATKSNLGTDINFGILTQKIFQYLEQQSNIKIYKNHLVKKIKKNKNQWNILVQHFNSEKYYSTDFLFIGAGGQSINLLNSTGIEEINGYAGFPVSGSWLVSKNPKLIEKHQSKVYGLAKVDAPPMSVPHLDLRIINGEKFLLFGPFAGFSTKFLKTGSYLDFFKSINIKNIPSLIGAGFSNIPLTQYLIQQVLMNKKHRIIHLKEFIKDAKNNDWEEIIAGQRVQIIKKDKKYGGKLEFGTEILINKEKNLASLLGASPGASVSVSIVLEILEKCFEKKFHNDWKISLNNIFPYNTYKFYLQKEAIIRHRNLSKGILKLKY